MSLFFLVISGILILDLHQNIPPQPWKNEKKRRFFEDDLQPLHTNGR